MAVKVPGDRCSSSECDTSQLGGAAVDLDGVRGTPNHVRGRADDAAPNRTRSTPKAERHKWAFARRFHRGAFGWKSQSRAPTCGPHTRAR